MTATLTRPAVSLPDREDMKNILVIDDLRIFDLECEYARNSTDAMEMLHKGEPWDVVYFDYDLGGNDTAEHVLYFLELCYYKEVPIEIGTCVIHSANPVGCERLEKGLSRYYDVERIDARNLTTGILGLE